MGERITTLLRQELKRAGLDHKVAYQEADDDSTDDEVFVYRAGEVLPFSVQVGVGYYVVNETDYDKPGDEYSIWVRQQGIYHHASQAARRVVQLLQEAK